MLKRYIVIISAVLFASQLACDKTEIVLPDNGGETQLFDLPDTWEEVSAIVPTYDNILLFGELITTDEHYWDHYISTYNLDTGDIERLLMGYSPSVSPDGNRMVYHRDWGDCRLTSFPPLDAGERLDVPGLDWGEWLDNSHIYYSIGGLGYANLILLNVDTLESRLLIESPDYGGFNAEVSPDKKSWVLKRGYGGDWGNFFYADLYAWDGDNLTFVRPLFDNNDGMYKCGPWSPDGTKLIVMGDRTDDPDWRGTTDRAVFTYDINTGEFTQLTFTDYKTEGGPQGGCWSADGNTIYFSTRERIFELDARKVYH